MRWPISIYELIDGEEEKNDKKMRRNLETEVGTKEKEMINILLIYNLTIIIPLFFI